MSRGLGDVYKRQIYVHGLHVKTPEALRARVRRLEDRLLEVLR